MPDLEISPKSVTVTVGQTQNFEAFREGHSVRDVQWSILPTKGAGTIDSDTGVYTPPKRLFRNSRAVVVARPAGGEGSPATAAIELLSHSFWTQFVGIYLLFSFFLLLGILVIEWERFCPTCKPDKVRVSPPVVTLGPSQSQSFVANVPVQWAGNPTVPGLYTAPKEFTSGGRDQITATMVNDSVDDSQKTGTAEVFLSPDGGLSLQPARATIPVGGSIDLTAVVSSKQATEGAVPALQIEWLDPESGTLTPLQPGNRTARFSTEGNTLSHPTTVMILARISGDSSRVAGAWITVLPANMLPGTCADGGSNVAALLRLIAIMGALGGLIHGISSFTTYVGNREFLISWTWWYVYKPFLSALVALVVFLVLRAGFGVGDFSLGAADCLKVAAFAGLIGLFAEPATLKLKDIFDTLFTPRDDPRRDPAGKARNSGPKLESLKPSTVKINEKPIPLLLLTGTGFLEDCQVKIGGTNLRKPTKVTSTLLEVPLTEADVEKAGKLDVVVFNKPPDGEPSNPLQLEVTG